MLRFSRFDLGRAELGECNAWGWGDRFFKNYHTNYFSQDFDDLKVPKSIRQSDEFGMLPIPSGKYPKIM